MKLIVDNGTVTVAAPEDLRRLSVELHRDQAGEAVLVLPGGLGRIEGEHAFLDIEALRALARVTSSCTWDARFDQAMEYAREHGWTDVTGASVRAHVTSADNAAVES